MSNPLMRRTGVPPYRALRFLLSNIDATDESAGLTISARGGLGMVERNDSVRQAIFLLLSTTPGERVMRPSYGCELRRLVFSPNDDTTAGLAIHYTRRALERWEPRIEIHRLDARRDPEAPGWLILLLEYRVRATQQVELATFSFSLTGDEF
ncbi:MAG: GPW/gp25 family protein [Chloroflexota bacterium]|nr:GPW/gp25 family protein [Chloroflexota bacterium]